MIELLQKAQRLLNASKAVDFIAPLLLRLYLAPIFWMAGTQKFGHFSSTVEWFGNADWGLGLPFPWLMAAMATGTELIGGVCLTFGFATRWISLPLMMTMLVAIFSVHLENGWLAIAAGGGIFATERTAGGVERLDVIKDILREHGNYEWLSENGSVVILNNGIEFATTYFFMLLALFFVGAGRYLSIDYFIAKKFDPSNALSHQSAT